MNLTVRPRPRRVGRLVVVADEPEVPAWVRTWCRRTGRELRTHLTPVVEPDGRVSLPELAEAIGPCVDDPVLVARRAPEPAPRVTVALRTLADDAAVLVEAGHAARDLGGTVHVLHGVPVSYGERSVGLDGAVARGRRLLDAARDRLAEQVPDTPVETRLVRAYPHEVVADECTDLLVVGGPCGAAPPGPQRFGPVTASALHHAPCTVLLVPRFPHGGSLVA